MTKSISIGIATAGLTLAEQCSAVAKETGPGGDAVRKG